jgi:hypothetical protein
MSTKKFFVMALALTLGFTSCEDEENTDDTPGVTLVGIQGTWQSSGTDVAPLLVNLFQTDSIYAEFNTNNTYLVEQYSNGAALTLEGTYTQQEDANGIWNITVNQTTPATLVSEGIFQVNGNSMQYEIVQTSPDIGATPPTAAEGFGSTNGGALGVLNVQVYKRLN